MATEHAHLIQNVLYFPNSPINILSVTKFANQLNNDNGTGITTFWQESVLFWDHQKYSCMIVHPALNLPEMSINDGFTLHSLWERLVGWHVDPAKHHHYCSLLSHMEDKELNYDFIWASSLANDIAKTLFHVGKTLLYSKEGHNLFAKVKEIFLVDNNKMKIWIVKPNGLEIVMSKDHPNIAFVPSTVSEYNKTTQHLSEEELSSVKNPVKLSPLQENGRKAICIPLEEIMWLVTTIASVYKGV